MFNSNSVFDDLTAPQLAGAVVLLIAVLVGLMFFDDYVDNKDLDISKFTCQNEQIDGADVQSLSSFHQGKYGPMIYIFKMKDGRKIRTEGCSKVISQ